MNQSREIHDRPETGENSAASAGPKNSVADTALYWISDVVFSLDLAGNFTYLSPSFRRITGISCDAMIGKHFTAFVPPEQHDSARRRFEIVRGDENGAITFSYSIQLPEKEPIPVEILLNRMEGPAGFEGFAGVARNIELRYAVASLIGATGEEYRYFIENIEDGY